MSANQTQLTICRWPLFCCVGSSNSSWRDPLTRTRCKDQGWSSLQDSKISSKHLPESESILLLLLSRLVKANLQLSYTDTLSAPFRLKLGRDFFSEDEPKPPQSLRKVDAPRDLVVGRLVNFVTQEALILLNFFHHLSGFLSQPLTNISLSGRRSPLRCFLGGGGLSPQAPSFWGMATGQHKECHGEMRVFKIMRATKLQTLSKKPPVLKTVVVPLRTPTPTPLPRCSFCPFSIPF